MTARMLTRNASNPGKFRPFAVRLAALASAAVLIGACGSDDDDDQPAPVGVAGPTSSETDPLQPTGGSGGAGGAGGAAAAGSAGTGNGSGGSETQSSDDLPNVAGAGNAPGGNAGGDATPDAGAPVPAADAGGAAGDDDSLDDGTMTFFVTSRGGDDGGNLGGLDGADAFCTELATAASPDFARRTWHAYLSTTDVDARDRIGTGPWRNQAGVVIANDVTQLHDQLAGGTLDQTWPVNDFAIPLDETGAQLAQNVHDILTGSDLDGTLEVDATGAPLNCADWTATTGMVQIGHTNRAGLQGQDPSWNSVHPTGCAPPGTPGQNVTSGGGRGSIYCFAVITGQ
jgi:hypothetical protein